MNEILKIKIGKSTEQNTNSTSHVGGGPVVFNLDEWPQCELCGNKMAFFFQIELIKTEYLVYIFNCVSCVDFENCIPPLYEVGRGLPNHSLGNNFKVLLDRKNSNAKILQGPQWIVYKELKLAACSNDSFGINKIGGRDDREKMYPQLVKNLTKQHDVSFQWQIVKPFQYKVAADAPIPLRLDGTKDERAQYYDLWANAKLFLYLCNEGDQPFPYLDMLSY